MELLFHFYVLAFLAAEEREEIVLFGQTLDNDKDLQEALYKRVVGILIQAFLEFGFGDYDIAARNEEVSLVGAVGQLVRVRGEESEALDHDFHERVHLEIDGEVVAHLFVLAGGEGQNEGQEAALGLVEGGIEVSDEFLDEASVPVVDEGIDFHDGGFVRALTEEVEGLEDEAGGGEQAGTTLGHETLGHVFLVVIVPLEVIGHLLENGGEPLEPFDAVGRQFALHVELSELGSAIVGQH